MASISVPVSVLATSRRVRVFFGFFLIRIVNVLSARLQNIIIQMKILLQPGQRDVPSPPPEHRPVKRHRETTGAVRPVLTSRRRGLRKFAGAPTRSSIFFLCSHKLIRRLIRVYNIIINGLESGLYFSIYIYTDRGTRDTSCSALRIYYPHT